MYDCFLNSNLKLPSISYSGVMKIARKIKYPICMLNFANVLSGPTLNHVTTGKMDITAKITVCEVCAYRLYSFPAL